MLKRDMIVALHLRVRLVATSDLKARVKDERVRKMRNFARRDHRSNHRSNPRSTSQDGSTVNVEELSPNTLSKNATFFLSPKTARRFARSKDSDRSGISALDFRGADETEEDTPESEVDSNSEPDEDDSGWDTTEDHVGPSMIDDPGKATPMQRRWLSAMSEGKAFAIARKFEKYVRSFKYGHIGFDCYVLIRINQYFDGKKSDDEILYRAEISRKQLREVLRHYDEYVGILRITDALGSITNFQCSCKYSYIHRKSTDFFTLRPI
jgi:nitrogen permease regulator 3